MKIVTKKITKKSLDLIEAGKKKFELRFADFDIEIGDILRLEEWETVDGIRKFTGKFVEKKVNYMQKEDVNEWLAKRPEILEKGLYILQFD